MTTSRSRTPAPPGPAPDGAGNRTDYAGAVYGSMLAASVIAASAVHEPHPRLSLVLLLVITGIVFWIAHVYAHVAGRREVGRRVTWSEVRRVGRQEWPLVEAAALPALAVLVSPSLGTGENAWLALGVAVAQQVTWATLGARRAGASSGQAAVEGAVNLLLGLVIVAAKVVVGH
ncbi:hypothetical protein F7Q99_01820 [Streptomyces kaniharaensis]|uniref:Integral membrane protein n=1 Tax=Streptomyces kaniharaensis TaxID=212423 RepID=A0A6N7KI92_9ACTN|nr:hypothetical protein [Streptomyces kaniharaensis]MQS11051.1 hypothetical protein [Streptomyces kaniharaensis]